MQRCARNDNQQIWQHGYPEYVSGTECMKHNTLAHTSRCECVVYTQVYILCVFFTFFNNHKYKHSTYTSRHPDSGKTLVIQAEGVIVIIYYGGGVLGSWCGFAEFIYHHRIYMLKRARERVCVAEGRVVRLLLFGFFDSSFRDCIKVCIAGFAFTSIYVCIGRYKYYLNLDRTCSRKMIFEPFIHKEQRGNIFKILKSL